MKLGKPAKIFVPTVTSSAKLDRMREYGADLVVGGDRYADALAASEAWMAQSGAMAIHAYDQIETLLGQGTVALELDEQTPRLDTLLVAVGGGGLIGGIAAWYAGKVKIVAVEPEAAPTLYKALEAGTSRRCRSWWDCRRLARASSRRRIDVSDCATLCRSSRAGHRRCDSASAGSALEDLAGGL